MNFLSENKTGLVSSSPFPMETANAGILQVNNNAETEQEQSVQNQNLKEVWTKENFDHTQTKGYLKASLSLDIKPLKTSWANEESGKQEMLMEEQEFKREPKEPSPSPSTPDKEASPSHHARRPMNAFLIFCKKHRPIVRQRFPHLENRGVTRILGEWWALLDLTEKSAYTNLAKEYKDAFFSANPDFKWYKLPAPPLRTLNTRPVNKVSSPLASPTQIMPSSTEFTPGKLADETQLGNLTSLMKPNSPTKTPENSNTNFTFDPDTPKLIVSNNNDVENDSEQHKRLLKTPGCIAVAPLPPKPIKKRKFEEFEDLENNKNVVRNIFNVKEEDDEMMMALDQNENSYIEEQCFESNTENCSNGFHNEPGNMTQQELMNKVVDSMFPQKSAMLEEWRLKEKLKETRKSGRSCKGKRYAEFMMEGKLLGNKQLKRFTQYNPDLNNKFSYSFNNKIENIMHNKSETQTPKLDLVDTIKRLAERTNTKLEDICVEPADAVPISKTGEKRKRTESETSEDGLLKLQSEFNLDMRISELPSLSYETFLQRKKDSKKRKSVRSKFESNATETKATKLSKPECSLVGSKKRKNKSSITRLEKPVNISSADYMSHFNNDLYGLATLAEIAANTEKIN